MPDVMAYIEQLSGFQQNLLASAVFGLTAWLVQAAYRRIKAGSSTVFREYSRLDVIRHILHKHYVHSSDVQKAAYGASISVLFAARWLMLTILIAIFFAGVHFARTGQWWFLAASWFCFNCSLEARNWLRDSADEKHIAHVPDDVKEHVFTRFQAAQPVTDESGQQGG